MPRALKKEAVSGVANSLKPSAASLKMECVASARNSSCSRGEGRGGEGGMGS
jgi:hypothetical protein